MKGFYEVIARPALPPFTPTKWWIFWASLYVQSLTPVNGRVVQDFRHKALKRHMKSAHTRCFWRSDMAYGGVR